MTELNNIGTSVPFEEAQELSWDGTISAEREPKSYVLLPEGDYAFIVERFEKSRYTPKSGSKIPACWAAILHLKVYPHEPNAEPVEMQSRLFLHSVQEWKLSEFFLAIGQKKHGEPLRMNWTEVPGSQGFLHVNHRAYNDKQYNNVQYFLDPARVSDDVKAYYSGTASAPAASFQAGKF